MMKEYVKIIDETGFFDTRTRSCTVLDCKHNKINDRRDTDLACRLKYIEIGEWGVCNMLEEKDNDSRGSQREKKRTGRKTVQGNTKV